MTASPVVVSPTWLVLRVGANAHARSLDLVEEVERWLPAGGRAVIQDLGPVERHRAPPGPAGLATMSVAALTAGRPGEPLTLSTAYVTPERDRAANGLRGRGAALESVEY